MPTRALRTAASGMYAQQVNIEVISNNIANVNTTSFKKNKAEFKDLMYQKVNVNPLSNSTPGIFDSEGIHVQVGNGVQAISTQKIFKQGDLTPTNNQFDLAIHGEGYFQIRKPDGNFLYSRDGSFKLNSDGTLITAGGYALDPDITLRDDIVGIFISRDGEVEVTDSSGSSYVLANIQLARFVNPGGLQAVGDNLYMETKASGPPLIGTPATNSFGEIHQGFLESSNVDIVEEMIAMITAQRAYEINSKTVKTVEEMMQLANNLKR